jgi:hypothetical protein
MKKKDSPLRVMLGCVIKPSRFVSRCASYDACAELKILRLSLSRAMRAYLEVMGSTG